jgi:hypothetical protein
MTGLAIAVCATQPRLPQLVAALAEADPTLQVLHDQERAVLVLAREAHPVLTVEAPVLVQVPGEASRLLGASMHEADRPGWWVHYHYAAGDTEAAALAATAGHRLASQCDGALWQSS